MEPISTKTLLSIVKTIAPKSPVARSGLVLLSLCASAAIVKRAFDSAGEAVTAGVIMIAGVVILTVVSYIAKKAPDPTVRFLARLVAVVVTVLFVLACVLVFTRFVFGWPAAGVTLQKDRTVSTIDRSVHTRLRSLREHNAATADAINRFLDTLDSTAWENLPVSEAGLLSELKRNSAEVSVLVAGTEFEGLQPDPDTRPKAPPIVITSDPNLLKPDLCSLIETRWRVAEPSSPIESSLGSLWPNLLVLRLTYQALPHYPDYPPTGSRGLPKTSEEYRSAYRQSIRQSLTFYLAKINESMRAIDEHELVRRIPQPDL